MLLFYDSGLFEANEHKEYIVAAVYQAFKIGFFRSSFSSTEEKFSRKDRTVSICMTEQVAYAF